MSGDETAESGSGGALVFIPGIEAPVMPDMPDMPAMPPMSLAPPDAPSFIGCTWTYVRSRAFRNTAWASAPR